MRIKKISTTTKSSPIYHTKEYKETETKYYLPTLPDHNVVRVPVCHPQHIGGDTVSCTRQHEFVHRMVQTEKKMEKLLSHSQMNLTNKIARLVPCDRHLKLDVHQTGNVSLNPLMPVPYQNCWNLSVDLLISSSAH